jgi:hypothetical protein
MYKFRLRRASEADRAWLQSTLDRESARFGTHVAQTDGALVATVAD